MGAAHFEMIIGFVFFIGFVMFLFIFLNPFDNSSLPKSALAGLHLSFLEEVNTELSSVFVDATDVPNPGGNCFSLRLPPNLFEYVSTGSGSKSLVKKLGGLDVDSSISNGDLNFNLEQAFFRIAISPEFTEESLSGCNAFPNPVLGSVVEIQIVSYRELGTMKYRYDNNYDALKTDLRLADIFDFAIIFEGLPEMSMEPSVETSGVVEVLAKEYVVKVLRSSGQISNERISIRIW